MTDLRTLLNQAKEAGTTQAIDEAYTRLTEFVYDKTGDPATSPEYRSEIVNTVIAQFTPDPREAAQHYIHQLQGTNYSNGSITPEFQKGMVGEEIMPSQDHQYAARLFAVTALEEIGKGKGDEAIISALTKTLGDAEEAMEIRKASVRALQTMKGNAPEALEQAASDPKNKALFDALGKVDKAGEPKTIDEEIAAEVVKTGKYLAISAAAAGTLLGAISTITPYIVAHVKMPPSLKDGVSTCNVQEVQQAVAAMDTPSRQAGTMQDYNTSMLRYAQDAYCDPQAIKGFVKAMLDNGIPVQKEDIKEAERQVNEANPAMKNEWEARNTILALLNSHGITIKMDEGPADGTPAAGNSPVTQGKGGIGR